LKNNQDQAPSIPARFDYIEKRQTPTTLESSPATYQSLLVSSFLARWKNSSPATKVVAVDMGSLGGTTQLSQRLASNRSQPRRLKRKLASTKAVADGHNHLRRYCPTTIVTKTKREGNHEDSKLESKWIQIPTNEKMKLEYIDIYQ
jgi:hypothetical protein